MPARKKSLSLLKLSGGLQNHPGRYAGRTDAVACTEGIGNPPSHISVARKNIWAELVAQLPEGHLQSADRALLEIVTFLMSKMRNRRTLITKGEISLLINALSKLGLSPVDRARVIMDRARVIIPVKPKASVYSQGWDDL